MKFPHDISDKLENGHEIPCKLKIGNDGKLYAVFVVNADAECYWRLFVERLGCRVACFGNYDNAYCFPIDKAMD